MSVQPSFWHKRLLWSIKLWEIGAFVAMHFFLAVLYIAAIWLTTSEQQVAGIAINYGLKVVLTLPFWWLFFRKLRSWSFLQKTLLHLPASALYVALWLKCYHLATESTGVGHMRGAGVWWDVYIPLLVYFVQFAVFHAYFYYTEILRQQEKEKALLRAAHTAELNVLKAQIQPHFLFNTLNSISASVPASQEHTRTLIAQLADVFRFAMNVTDKESVPLKKEIQFIQNFLALEQQRFGDRLSVSYDVDKRLDEYALPPMLLQPLVENAVKHGIAKSVEGGKIFIRIQQQANSVSFEIRDTGKGINGTAQEQLFQKGIGLENTRQRLLRLYNAPLVVKNGEPRGCSVQFSLPLQNTKDGKESSVGR